MVELDLVKPCVRCVMTTYDQNTGVKENNEPIATLAKVRHGAADGLKGVFFGQNAVPDKFGSIHVGDRVEILSTRPLHPALSQNALRYERNS